jgi:hypothetical protein
MDINPLKPNLVWTVFKNAVRTSKRTQHFTITKISWLILLKEVIPVYTDNHMYKTHKYKIHSY